MTPEIAQSGAAAVTAVTARTRLATFWSKYGRHILICYLLIAPVIVLRIFTAGWPIISTTITSFHESNPTLGPDRWIGLGNYQWLIDNPQFIDTLSFTVVYAGLSTVLEVVLGLALAVLLHQQFRGRRFLRAVNLIPWAVPAVVAGIAFRFSLDPDYGVIADLLSKVGFGDVLWLVDTLPAQAAVIGVNVWRNAGFVAVLLLAALQTIPKELYEAASVDGASKLRQFISITLPLVLPVVVSAGTFMLVWQIPSFDLVLSMTGGGPGTATEVLGHQAYKMGFQNFDFGKSAAVAVCLLVLVAAIAFAGNRASKGMHGK